MIPEAEDNADSQPSIKGHLIKELCRGKMMKDKPNSTGPIRVFTFVSCFLLCPSVSHADLLGYWSMDTTAGESDLLFNEVDLD